MRLTAYSDYSIRILAYLTLKAENKSTIAEVSETYGISKEHVRKIVHHLVKEGYITSTRGRLGGLLIAKEAHEINIGELVRTTEADFNIVECFDDENNDCILKGACKLQAILNTALQAFLEVLDQYTLKDLLTPQNAIMELLDIKV